MTYLPGIKYKLSDFRSNIIQKALEKRKLEFLEKKSEKKTFSKEFSIKELTSPVRKLKELDDGQRSVIEKNYGQRKFSEVQSKIEGAIINSERIKHKNLNYFSNILKKRFSHNTLTSRD